MLHCLDQSCRVQGDGKEAVASPTHSVIQVISLNEMLIRLIAEFVGTRGMKTVRPCLSKKTFRVEGALQVQTRR